MKMTLTMSDQDAIGPGEMMIQLKFDDEAQSAMEMMERANTDEEGFDCIEDNFGEEKCSAFSALLLVRDTSVAMLGQMSEFTEDEPALQ